MTYLKFDRGDLEAHEVIMAGIRKAAEAEQTELEKLKEQNRELLEALKAVRAEWDKDFTYRDYGRAIALVDAAIAKAEGK